MSINYPLSIPGPIYPSDADLKMFDGVAEFMSPFAPQAEQQQFADQHWELDLSWPPMTWAQFAGTSAFAAALHGKFGRFLWGPPLATAPRGLGLAAGTPVCTGVDSPNSGVLTTARWLPNQNGVLLPGDYVQTGPYYEPGPGGVGVKVGFARLYQYVGAEPLNSDSGGNAVIDIFPSLRETPYPNSLLILLSPQGEFRSAENRRSAPAKKTKTFTFSMKCREAV